MGLFIFSWNMLRWFVLFLRQWTIFSRDQLSIASITVTRRDERFYDDLSIAERIIRKLRTAGHNREFCRATSSFQNTLDCTLNTHRIIGIFGLGYLKKNNIICIFKAQRILKCPSNMISSYQLCSGFYFL